MSRWEIGIRTDGFTFSHGDEYFRINECIDYHDMRYHTISSDCFDKITPEDQNKAQSIIYGVVAIANGAFALALGDGYKYIEINRNEIKYDGNLCSLTKNDYVPEMNPYKTLGMTYYKPILSVVNINIPYHLIVLSRAYPPIREILFLVGCYIDDPNINRNISTWTILYAMYDTIYFYSEEMAKTHAQKKNEERVSAHLSIDMLTLKRFTQTANNFDYLGIFSRHGKRRHEAPKRPMELSQAEDFVFKMSMAFFEAFIAHEQQKERDGI